MHPGPIVVAADQPLVEAARLLEDQRVEVLAVVDGHGRPVGVITAADLIRALAGHARAEDTCADRGQDQAEAVRRR
jgi:CBS domain-containing protein